MKIMIIFIKRYYFSSYIIFFILFLTQFSISYINIQDNIFESIQLNNGNILLISVYNYYIVDPSFTRVINQTEFYYFGSCDNNQIVHFPKEDGAYILFRECEHINFFLKMDIFF